MYVLVYLRPLSQGSLQNSYSPITSVCSCLSQLCQGKVGLVQRLVKAAHLIVTACRVQDKFPPEFRSVKTKDFEGMEKGTKLLNGIIKQF